MNSKTINKLKLLHTDNEGVPSLIQYIEVNKTLFTTMFSIEFFDNTKLYVDVEGDLNFAINDVKEDLINWIHKNYPNILGVHTNRMYRYFVAHDKSSITKRQSQKILRIGV